MFHMHIMPSSSIRDPNISYRTYKASYLNCWKQPIIQSCETYTYPTNPVNLAQAKELSLKLPALAWAILHTKGTSRSHSSQLLSLRRDYSCSGECPSLGRDLESERRVGCSSSRSGESFSFWATNSSPGRVQQNLLCSRACQARKPSITTYISFSHHQKHIKIIWSTKQKQTKHYIYKSMKNLVFLTWNGAKRKYNGPRGRGEQCNSNQCSKLRKQMHGG